MRLKFLFFPIAFISIIVLLIWYIIPAYQKSKDLMQTLHDKQEYHQLLVERQKIVSRLTNEINQNKVAEDFLLHYIPFQNDEEYIINAVNNAATASGVGLIAIDIEGKNKKSLFTGTDKNGLVNAKVKRGQDGSTIGSLVVEKKPLKEDAISISVVGPYESMKNFFTAIHNVDRLHDASHIIVEALEDNSSEGLQLENAPQDEPSQKAENSSTIGDVNLLGKFTLVFAHSPSVVIPRGADSPVFHRDHIDLNKVAEIQSKMVTAPALVTDNQSRNNPFVLPHETN